MKKIKLINKRISTLALMLVLVFGLTPTVLAAPLSSLSNTLTRLKTSETASHTVVFTTPSGISNGQTVTLTFPSSSFTMGASLSGVTINGGAVTSASWSAPTLTITASASSTVSAGNVATIVIPNNQITNPSTPDTYLITIGGTFGDTGKIAIAILENEQIPVTASVNPTISLAITNTALALGILDSGTISTSDYNNIVIGTNGSGGYTITVRGYGNGASDGLYNFGANKLIGSSATTLSAGTEGYGGQCNKVSGNGTCAASYNYSTNQVGELGMAAATFASYNQKPTGSDTFQIRVKAAISTSTEAGSYSDTLTIIGTANF